ncbi:MAG: helix-turn-helix domain-containing protein [Spirulinaceae cyanobacterium]
MMPPLPPTFPTLCRQWRKLRKFSQLDLALVAGVSQRHVSWLETGRSQPSRAMIVRLSEAMEIPLRDRNVLLQAAGYAATYFETALEEPMMAPILEVLNQVLQNHEPLPAVVVDRVWTLKKANRAAELLFSLGGDPQALLDTIGANGEFNLALLTLHPQGLRPYITNWEQIAPSLVRRLRNEALVSHDPTLQQRFSEYIALAEPIEETPLSTPGLLPVLPLALNFHGLELSLFSVISSFGTPQDITADELRIETFYPMNAQTEQFFRRSP